MVQYSAKSLKFQKQPQTFRPEIVVLESAAGCAEHDHSDDATSRTASLVYSTAKNLFQRKTAARKLRNTRASHCFRYRPLRPQKPILKELQRGVQ
jgi:hypothetical protein